MNERINRGFISEKRGTAMCHATPSGVKAYDFKNGKGATENKHGTIVKTSNYKTEGHDKYNGSHAHAWVLNENGEKDYILTCEAMANESDRIRYTQGATGKERAEYYNTYEERFNFYFCRLAWQCEANGKLVVNPISTRGGCKEVPGLAGRRATLQNLINHGVVNVPTFEEIERAYLG